MTNRINSRDEFTVKKPQTIILKNNYVHDDVKKPITEVFYINELVSSVYRRKVKDLGFLEPPWPPTIGMDKVQTRSKVLGYIVDFAHGSSIHGLNHLVAPRRHPLEKFLVALILLGSVGGLILISLDSWHRYRKESTSLVLDNNFRKFKISKPSVTICPIDLLDDTKFPEVFQKYKINDTERNRKFMHALSKMNYGNMAELTLDADYDDIPASMWLKLLYELRGQVKVWNEYAMDEFVWTSTERGLCMLFASNVADYFNVESWISNEPKKSYNASKKLTLDVDDYGVVKSISCFTHNFWIWFHHPDTVIDYLSPGKMVTFLKLNTLTLKISEVSTSDNVELLSVQQRNCKLPDDAGLSTWPVYSTGMCKLECRYKAIKKLCGCIPHFAKPQEGTSTCDYRQLTSCVASNLEEELLSLTSEECGCLQDCNEALYIDKEYTSFLLKEGSPYDAVMNLNIDFPQVKYVHEELFSFTDLLASIGGAAGLFLGASVLSFCEILYFLTLRLIRHDDGRVKKQNEKKKLKSGGRKFLRQLTRENVWKKN